MEILDLEQGSDEWLKARCGVITASGVSKLITSTGLPSKQASSYIDQIIGEAISGEFQGGYKTPAMERGNELEPQARDWYEFFTGNDVTEVGMVKRHKHIGCSPDGLILENGLPAGGLEIKCPLPQTQVKYLRHFEKTGKMPTEYVPQVQYSLWVTGLEWWDFVSFHPKMENVYLRVERDTAIQEALDDIIYNAVETIEKEIQKWSIKDE
jgi:hypothetical protein